MNLFKHLNKAGVWPSGRPRYYFRPKGGKNVPLPDWPIDSSDFLLAYEIASNGVFTGPVYRNPAQTVLGGCLTRARARAKARRVPFALTLKDLRAAFFRQKGRCAITGIHFDMTNDGDGWRRPFIPSIDRVEPSAGYIPSNIRLTCTIANLARGDFGDAAFFRMCSAARKNKVRTKLPTPPS